MKKYFLIITLVLLAFQSCKENTDSKTNKQTSSVLEVISVKDMNSIINSKEEIQLIDVRSPQEFSEGHLKGAKLMCVTCPGFENKIKSLDTTLPVYVYCEVGGRSGHASKIFKKAGFQKIYDMKGGTAMWKKNNFKFVK